MRTYLTILLTKNSSYLVTLSLDDDGSGTVTILEAFRALVYHGFTPKYPVEFHWYAAEEGGLLGSLDIVKGFVETGRNVKGMLQFVSKLQPQFVLPLFLLRY